MVQIIVQEIICKDTLVECELLPTKSKFSYKVKYNRNGKEIIRYVPKEDEKVIL